MKNTTSEIDTKRSSAGSFDIDQTMPGRRMQKKNGRFERGDLILNRYKVLAELGQGRRTWAVLGEMLELGDSSVNEHDAIGRYVVRLNISQLIVVGTGARAMHTGAVMEGSWGDESVFVESPEDAERILESSLQPGDLVLFKSSNGAALRHLGDRIALNAPSSTTALPPASAPQHTSPDLTGEAGGVQ